MMVYAQFSKKRKGKMILFFIVTECIKDRNCSNILKWGLNPTKILENEIVKVTSLAPRIRRSPPASRAAPPSVRFLSVAMKKRRRWESR
jgi:hypothetical protein